MKSPFPGMDPYLEQRWRDLHTRLVHYSCDEIQTRLPTDLFAHVLNLQSIVEMCYAKRRYETLIAYQQDPDPPLEGHDAEWADSFLRTAGRRK